MGEEENAFESGIKAIGYGNIDDPIFASQRHGRLGPVFGQGKQACAGPTPQDNGQDTIKSNRFVGSRNSPLHSLVMNGYRLLSKKIGHHRMQRCREAGDSLGDRRNFRSRKGTRRAI